MNYLDTTSFNTRSFLCPIAVFSLVFGLDNPVSAQPALLSVEHPSNIETPAYSAVMENVQERLDERVDRGTNRSIVIGISSRSGTHYLKSGTFREGDTRQTNKRSVFETASITEIFTVLAASICVENRLFSWEDSIGELLGTDWKIPEFEGAKISIQHLAHHSSGLPGLPDDYTPSSNFTPLSDYTRADLMEFISGYSLLVKPGSRPEHSMIGMALLGFAIEAKTGLNIEDFFEREIFDPLGMPSTSVTLSELQRYHYARGHSGDDQTPPWSAPAFTGGSGVRSNAEDLLRYAASVLGLNDTPLGDLLRKSITHSVPEDREKIELDNGWFAAPSGDGTVYFRHGNTTGHASFIGINKERSLGVVGLTNSAESIDRICYHLLNPDVHPLPPLKSLIPVSDAQLRAYAGAFELPSGRQILITRRDGKLYAQVNHAHKHQILPVGEDAFYYPFFNSNLKFLRGQNGRLDEIEVAYEGEETVATRVKVSR